VISFLWNTYSNRGEHHEPAGIAESEAKAERCVRRAFEADAAITDAVIREVKLTASPGSQLFEWQPVRTGLIFARVNQGNRATGVRVVGARQEATMRSTKGEG
jgi:hypothetical protein